MKFRDKIRLAAVVIALVGFADAKEGGAQIILPGAPCPTVVFCDQVCLDASVCTDYGPGGPGECVFQNVGCDYGVYPCGENLYSTFCTWSG